MNLKEMKIGQSIVAGLDKPGEEPAKEIGQISLSIGDSGASIQVVMKEAGPILQITSSAFGNLIQEFNIKTTPKDLVAIAKMLLEAAKHEYPKEHAYPAKQV